MLDSGLQGIFALTNFVLLGKMKVILSMFLLNGFLLTFISVPFIATLARKKHLLVELNFRSSHTYPTPAFGGISIFLGFFISVLVFSPIVQDGILKVLVSITVIFLIGLADDLVDIKAGLKLFLFIITSIFLCYNQGFLINDFHGFLSISHLNMVFAFPITVFAIITIINAINLIDGIDGLASGLGILILGIFSWVFYRSDHISYLIFSLPMMFSLFAFFLYNIWGKRFKMFMGDSGSLLLGLIISICVILFLGLDQGEIHSNIISVSMVSVFGIMVVPLFDLVFVFIKRLSVGKSPFHPGKEHIHHTYLKFGLKHGAITLILIVFTFVFFILSQVLLNYLSEPETFGLLLLLATTKWVLLGYFSDKHAISSGS